MTLQDALRGSTMSAVRRAVLLEELARLDERIGTLRRVSMLLLMPGAKPAVALRRSKPMAPKPCFCRLWPSRNKSVGCSKLRMLLCVEDV